MDFTIRRELLEILIEFVEQLFCIWTKQGYGTVKLKCLHQSILSFRCRKRDNRFVTDNFIFTLIFSDIFICRIMHFCTIIVARLSQYSLNSDILSFQETLFSYFLDCWLYIIHINIYITPAPVVERYIVMSMSVCFLFVCFSICISYKLQVITSRNSLRMLPVTVCRSSFGGALQCITYFRLRMTSRFPTMDPIALPPHYRCNVNARTSTPPALR